MNIDGGGCVSTSLHDDERNFPFLARMADAYTCGWRDWLTDPINSHSIGQKNCVACMRAGRCEIFLNTSSDSENST